MILRNKDYDSASSEFLRAILISAEIRVNHFSRRIFLFSNVEESSITQSNRHIFSFFLFMIIADRFNNCLLRSIRSLRTLWSSLILR